jgi:pimeloyl-ACP methyl ester carboxylesterase
MALRFRLLPGLVVLVLLAVALPATASATSRSFHWGRCPTRLPAKLAVDCGVLAVPETRAGDGSGRRSRRTVELPVVIIRSADRSHAKSPVVFLDGGPSFNELNPFTVKFLAGLPFAAHRDVILYNERGVGFARPRLGCPEFDRVLRKAFPIDPLYQHRSIRMFLAADAACRRRLAGRGINLRAYDAEADAADLNDLRIALGYRRWNLFAASADGVVASTEMRLYPGGLRSVALDSPVGNQWKMRGPDMVRTSIRMLDKVFAGCAASAQCNRTYPNLRARFYRRVDALRRHPVVLKVPLRGRAPFPITFNGDLVLNMAVCFDPVCAASSPRVLDEAARGDIRAYEEDIFGGPLTPAPPSEPVFSEGKTAIFHCRDYIAFEPDSELYGLARELPEWRATLLTLRYTSVPTSTKQACKRWHVGRADAAQHRPVRSPIPTLVLTGEWDGVIGPPEQERVAGYLPNSFRFVFPGIGHFTTLQNPCPGVILSEFLSRPTAKPNSSCIGSMPEVSFAPSQAAATRPTWPEAAWNLPPG